METGADSVGQMTATSMRLARLLLAIGENRLELLMVALRDERRHVLQALLLALGMAVLGLLAGMALTATLVVLWWDRSPVVVLAAFAAFYAAAGLFLSWRLARLMRDWRTLSTLLDQVREDGAALEQTLQ